MTGSGIPETTSAQTPLETNLPKADLNSPENLHNPARLYRELRERSPVHWADEAQAWLITRHGDVTNGYRDPRLSSERPHMSGSQLYEMLPPEYAETITDFIASNKRVMLMRDGIPHLSIRRQASPSFSPQSIDAYVPAIRRVINELVEELKPRGSMNLVRDFAFELPLLVIAEFLNLPREDRTRFQAWSKPLGDFVSPAPGTDIPQLVRQALQASKELRAYLSDIINERRDRPGQDPISQMIQAGRMTHEELVANTLVMVTAGHITTADQLANGIYDLLGHQDQLQLLLNERNLCRSAVEEMLRYNPAAPFMSRIATEDIKLHGKTIQKGQLVLLGMAAANRDPSVFPDPERFDITRDYMQQRHLTFAFGPHHCLGAGLARRELELATETLLDQLPGLHLDEARPPDRKPQGFIFRGFYSLHVKW